MSYQDLSTFSLFDLNKHLNSLHGLPYKLVATDADQAVIVPSLMNNALGYAQGAHQSFQQSAGFLSGPTGTFFEDNYERAEGLFRGFPSQGQFSLDDSVVVDAEQAIMAPSLMNNELGYAQGAHQAFQQGAGFQPVPAGVYLEGNYEGAEGSLQEFVIEGQSGLYSSVAADAEQAVMASFLMNHGFGHTQGAQQTLQQGAGFQPGPAGVSLGDNYETQEGTLQEFLMDGQFDLGDMNFN